MLLLADVMIVSSESLAMAVSHSAIPRERPSAMKPGRPLFSKHMVLGHVKGHSVSQSANRCRRVMGMGDNAPACHCRKGDGFGGKASYGAGLRAAASLRPDRLRPLRAREQRPIDALGATEPHAEHLPVSPSDIVLSRTDDLASVDILLLCCFTFVWFWWPGNCNTDT